MGERRGCYEVTRPTTDIKQRKEHRTHTELSSFKIMMMEAATDLPAATAVKEGVPGVAEPGPGGSMADMYAPTARTALLALVVASIHM